MAEGGRLPGEAKATALFMRAKPSLDPRRRRRPWWRRRRGSGWSRRRRRLVVCAVLDALVDLVDCLLGEVDCGDPMSTFVILRLLQIVPGVKHVLLERVRRAGAQGGERDCHQDSGDNQPEF